MKKIYLYVNSTTQRCPNKIFKTFLIEDFSICHRRQIHECRNGERGHAVSFLGIHKSDVWYRVRRRDVWNEFPNSFSFYGLDSARGVHGWGFHSTNSTHIDIYVDHQRCGMALFENAQNISAQILKGAQA